MQTHHPRVIFILYHDLNIGGVQRKIVDIVNRLRELPEYKNTCVHLLLTESDNNILASQIRNPNVIIHHISLPRYSLLWAVIFAYALWYRPDTFLAFLPLPALHAYIAKRLLFWRNIRFVINEDVITSHAFQRINFTPRVNHMLPYVFSHADALLTSSKPAADDLARRYHVPKNLLVHTQSWTVVQKSSKKFPKQVDCVYVGRFSKEKRIPLLLAAVAQIRKNKPDISLLLVGEGEELDRIMEYTERLHLTRNVKISKSRTDVYSILSSAKLAVFASESECVPQFILEAMSAGLPVVSMHFPGAEDIIAQNRSGIICHNTSQLIIAVKKLLSRRELRSSMGRFAKQTVNRYYSPSNIDTYFGYIFPTVI